MSPSRRRLVRRLLVAACGEERTQRLLRMPLADQGLGYDPFGCERESAMAAFLLLRYLYRYWFRVGSSGIEHVPATGRAILASNHSGLLPFDGAMIGVDCALKLAQPRLVRAVVDKSVFGLPLVGTWFLRCGQVPGTKRNFEELLREEQLVLVFPEGARGSTKPYRERYRLRPFNVGFVELAIAERTPIVPVAVVGAEEQAPVLLGSERLGRRIGLPFLPVTPTFPLLGPLGLIPYPVRYTIHYGRPIDAMAVDGVDPEAARALEPGTVRRIAEHVRGEVQALIDRGLAERGRPPRGPATPKPGTKREAGGMTGHEAEREPAREAGRQAAREAGGEAARGAARDARREAGREAGREAARGAAGEARHELAREAARETPPAAPAAAPGSGASAAPLRLGEAAARGGS